MSHYKFSVSTGSNRPALKPGRVFGASAVSVQRGFSMVELMVAMALSLILLGGVGQIFVSSKHTYRSQEANSRLQESGRIATTLLQRNIRPAGFQGCRSMSVVTPSVVANAPVPAINAASVVSGHEGSSGSWSPALPTGLGTVTSGTDVITIQHASECGANLTANMASASADIQLNFPNACNFSAGEVLVISDCTSADVFRADSVSSGSGAQAIEHDNSVNTSSSLSKAYDDDADVMKFSSFTYFIATGGDGLPSLWRFDNTRAAAASVNPVELVSNVADMQIEYGQDSLGGDQVADFYATANNVTDWASVISVRISLLIQTLSDNITTQAQTYTYNRASVTAPDRHLYRVFTTTISLRNKVS